MYKHLIFDFDGTISDTYPLFLAFYREIVEKHGLTMQCNNDELYRGMKDNLKVGYQAMRINEEALPYKPFLKEVFALQGERYRDFQAFPAAVELLQKSVENGRKNYIYTHSNGEVVSKMLQNMGIDHLFEFMLDSTYPFPRKPAPDALNFLVEKLSLDRAECLMIGDRPIDALAGMNAGMKGCLWDAEGLFPDEKIDYIVKDLAEIAEICGFSM